MKRCVVLLLMCTLLLSACASTVPVTREEQGLSIVTTIFPAYDFAREICGESAEITMLIPPGSEIHSYEPTPQDIIKIHNCDIFICNGGESEAWVSRVLESVDNKNMTVIYMLDCVTAIEEETKEGMQAAPHAGEHGEEEEGPEYDEHVWTSPVNAQLISRAVCDAAAEADPDNARAYLAACEAYCAKLSELDAAFRGAVERGGRDTLIFADRFPVRYFTEEYGLDYYAAFSGCADDAEPSAKTVAFLIDRVREDSTPAVLYIEFSNEKMADVICEDTGCEKLLFHSCHNISKSDLESGATYLSLMWGNVKTIEEALG